MAALTSSTQAALYGSGAGQALHDRVGRPLEAGRLAEHLVDVAVEGVDEVRNRLGAFNVSETEDEAGPPEGVHASADVGLTYPSWGKQSPVAEDQRIATDDVASVPPGTMGMMLGVLNERSFASEVVRRP